MFILTFIRKEIPSKWRKRVTTSNVLAIKRWTWQLCAYPGWLSFFTFTARSSGVSAYFAICVWNSQNYVRGVILIPAVKDNRRVENIISNTFYSWILQLHLLNNHPFDNIHRHFVLEILNSDIHFPILKIKRFNTKKNHITQ